LRKCVRAIDTLEHWKTRLLLKFFFGSLNLTTHEY
jgi:hypothetical protein